MSWEVAQPAGAVENPHHDVRPSRAHLLDPAVLGNLVAEFDGDCTVARGFVSRFLTLATDRWERIVTAVHLQDGPESEIALLSLQTTGAMLGADQLDLQCERELDAVRQQDWESAVRRLAEVSDTLTSTRDALTTWLSGGCGHTSG